MMDEDNFKFDYDRAATLLHVVEMVSKVAPGYTAIASEAMSELREINEEILTLAKERNVRLLAESAKRRDEQQKGLVENPEPSRPIDAESHEAFEERKAAEEDRQAQLNYGKNPTTANVSRRL